MVNSENLSEDNIEEWLQSDACEVGFQHIQTDIINAAAKQKGEEGGENESEIHTVVSM
jgi:hypothetical protein